MDIKESFLGHFDRLIAKPAGRLERVIEFGHLRMPPDASMLEHPRIIICLKGVAHILRQKESDGDATQLEVGDGLFIAARRWVRATPRVPYICIGVIYYPDYTRLYISRTRKQGRKDLSINLVETVIPAVLPDEWRNLLRLLAGPAPMQHAERFYRDAFSCLCIATRDLLVRDQASEHGKAYFTFKAACHYIAENLHRAFGRKELAAELRIHPNHVSRLFLGYSGRSFSLYLQDQRLARARLLLEDPRLNVAEVARLSGFSSSSYFIRVFRAHFDTTPTEAR